MELHQDIVNILWQLTPKIPQYGICSQNQIYSKTHVPHIPTIMRTFKNQLTSQHSQCQLDALC